MDADNPLSGQLEKGQPIMGTTFAQGQLAQLSSNINIAVATALPKVAEKYDPKVVLKALEGRGEVFAGYIETMLEQAINSMLVLAPRGSVTVTLTERHDPDEFYRTREGLYVWGDYRSRIVTKAKPSEAGTTVKIESAELMRDLTDAEIEAALPKGHLFDETQVSAVIAGLIAKQPNGEEGALVNTGRANLFYTDSYVVRVRWVADDRMWYVGACRRDDGRWRAGFQVFSPAN